MSQTALCNTGLGNVKTCVFFLFYQVHFFFIAACELSSCSKLGLLFTVVASQQGSGAQDLAAWASVAAGDSGVQTQ